MESYSSEELFLYCEKLKKKLTRYEARFSALVDAYKQIVEEKQILETTLKTLSSKPSSKTTSKGDDSTESTVQLVDPLGAIVLDDSSVSDDVNQSVIGDECTEISQEDLIRSLEEKVAALSTALQSVTESKAKMESAFQADKKSMMAEFKSKIGQFESEKNEALQEERQMKGKLCQEQAERKFDVETHASMLKELQQVLTSERLEKEELKTQLREHKMVMNGQVNEQCKKYEEKMNELQNKLNKSEAALQMQQEEKKKPSQIIKGLTEQVENIKLEHENTLLMEQNRANNAEEIFRACQIQEEKRIAELEFRLSELSDIVGNYDKRRQEDQAVIRKQKERLENLDAENTALSTNHTDMQQNDNKVAELEEQASKLKNLLKITWKKSDRNLDVLLSNSEIDDILKNDPIHTACHAEYKQLKEEFECYKRQQKIKKTQIKNDHNVTVDQKNNSERKIFQLETDLNISKDYYEEREKGQLSIISQLQVDITCLREKHDWFIESMKEEHKKNLKQVENELQKQRTRTIDLISEKELELERLQKIVFDYEDHDQKVKLESSFTSFPSDNETTIVDKITGQSPVAGSSGGGFFHFTQQLSQYETELSGCRSQIIDLEVAIRDGEHREQQLLHQMQALKEEIRRLERNRSRESANLEYLKNISLQFMLTDSPSVKKQMSLAIATVLTFSPSEMAQVKKRQSTGWW